MESPLDHLHLSPGGRHERHLDCDRLVMMGREMMVVMVYLEVRRFDTSFRRRGAIRGKKHAHSHSHRVAESYILLL